MTDKAKDEAKPVPTYGYKSGEEPRIFDLKPGDDYLPSGWHDTPQPDNAADEDPRRYSGEPAAPRPPAQRSR